MNLGRQCPRIHRYGSLYPSKGLQKALCDYYAAIIRLCKHVTESLQKPGTCLQLFSPTSLFILDAVQELTCFQYTNSCPRHCWSRLRRSSDRTKGKLHYYLKKFEMKHLWHRNKLKSRRTSFKSKNDPMLEGIEKSWSSSKTRTRKRKRIGV